MRLSVLLCMLLVWLAGCSTPAPHFGIETDGFHANSIDVVGLRYTDAEGRIHTKVKKLDSVPAVFTELFAYHKPSFYDYSSERVAKHAAVEWLRHVGVTPVISPEVRETAIEEQRRQLRQQKDASVRIGVMSGAVWLIDVRVDERNPWRAGVHLWATSIETGEVVWSGTARSPYTAQYYESSPRPECIRLLTDHALATAFGFQQPGRQAGGCQ